MAMIPAHTRLDRNSRATHRARRISRIASVARAITRAWGLTGSGSDAAAGGSARGSAARERECTAICRAELSSNLLVPVGVDYRTGYIRTVFARFALRPRRVRHLPAGILTSITRGDFGLVRLFRAGPPFLLGGDCAA